MQRVEEKAWDAITLLAEKGGWEDMDLKPKKGKATAVRSTAQSAEKPQKPKPRAKAVARRPDKKTKERENLEESEYNEGEEVSESETELPKARSGKKRKARGGSDEEYVSPRRSTRTRR